jgi:hypothetical protein
VTDAPPGSAEAAALEPDAEGPDGAEGGDLDEVGEEEAAVAVESVSYQVESPEPADTGSEAPAVDGPQERRDSDIEG